MENVFGVDISKDWFDVSGPGGAQRFATGEAAVFAARAQAAGAHVVFEACGGYERPLRQALEAAGVACCRVNPRRARCFATGVGRLAKTDRVDAAALEEMGRRLDLPLTPPEDETLRKLRALRLRRRQLTMMSADERRRLRQTADAEMARSITAHDAALKREIQALDARIRALIRDDAELAERARILSTAPGVGPVALAALLAEMPELGRLTPGAAAALVGVAPIAHESGQRARKRRIGGGRKSLRDTLYMAGLTAARLDPTLRAFAERLKKNGKAPKQAIIAVTRKLVIILNAMVRENTPYQTG